MSADAAMPGKIAAGANASAPFLSALLRALRSQDALGGLDSKSPEQLLAGYVYDRSAVMLPFAFPSILPPVRRIECFFGAVAREVERRSGRRTSAMVGIGREGLGRGVVLVGRLVGALVYIRDADGFGFPSLEELNAEGERLTSESLALAAAHPDVAAM
jgi:probable nitrogen fixation protein